MEIFIDNFFANPLLYIGGLMSLCAAVAFIIFLAGFAGGLPHLFTNSESDEHMEHSRTRTMWGLGWLILIFGVWEIIRFLWGLAPRSHALFGLFLIFVLYFVPWYIKWYNTPKKSSH